MSRASSSATTAPRAPKRRSTPRWSLATQLGDKIVIVFGYAPGGSGGGEVPAHREAVKELGEKVTQEAVERGARGRRGGRAV